MKIYFASDHAGYEMKTKLMIYGAGLGYDIEDCGPYIYDPNDDYPDFVAPCADSVATHPESIGIVIGGSSQGEAMVANRTIGIRCAVFYGSREAVDTVDLKGTKSVDAYEIVRLSRQHNNANMLSLASRFLSVTEAKNALRVFLETSFSHEESHSRRIEKF